MSKIKAITKIVYVKKYLEGKISQKGIANKLNVSLASVQQWISNYKSLDEDAFIGHKNRRYSPKLQRAAVQDYLSGVGSQQVICQKYGIRAKSQLQNWIKKYNGHEDLKCHGTKGLRVMTKGKKTSFKERIEIVQYCISHGKNYIETSEKYHVSYQQVRNYTVKYELNGVDDLQDRRGKRKTENEMTEMEKLRAENRLLKAEKEHAEMEVSFLKKLEEIERRRD